MTVDRKFYILTDGVEVVTSLVDDMPLLYETEEQAEAMAFDNYVPKEVIIGYEVEIGNRYPKSCFQETVKQAHKNSKEAEKKIKEQKKWEK